MTAPAAVDETLILPPTEFVMVEPRLRKPPKPRKVRKMVSPPGYYSVSEAADVLGLAEATLREKIKSGQVGTVQQLVNTVTGETRILVPQAAIDAYNGRHRGRRRPDGTQRYHVYLRPEDVTEINAWLAARGRAEVTMPAYKPAKTGEGETNGNGSGAHETEQAALAEPPPF